MVGGLPLHTNPLLPARCVRARRPIPAQPQLLPRPYNSSRGPSRSQVAQSFDTGTATAPPAAPARRQAPAGADAAAAAGFPADQQQLSAVAATLPASSGSASSTGSFDEQSHQQAEVPKDVLREFEQKLEADLQSVAVTVTAVTGVIIYWRGVWSLLDNVMGDSLFGDICCIIVGLTIVLAIRLSGVKVASSFWPNG